MTIYELTTTWYDKEEQRRVQRSIALYKTLESAEKHKKNLVTTTALARVVERTVKD